MCMSQPSGGDSSAAILQQMNKGNATLSNQQVASTTKEKTGTKKTVNSLRVPLKNKAITDTTGINTSDTATGLNIPV